MQDISRRDDQDSGLSECIYINGPFEKSKPGIDTALASAPPPAFTWRAVILGTFIGCILSAQNVYFGLRNGMSFGDGLVSSLVGYMLVKSFKHYFPSTWRGFHLHEHVVLQVIFVKNSSLFI